MTQSRLSPEELFSPEMLELQGQALELNEFFDMGRDSVEIDEYGIYNNSGFRREAPKRISQALINGTEVGMIIGDLDGLKAVNDEFGHPVGDEVIAGAKAVIKELKEEFDIPLLAGRVGGDEFAILVEGNPEQTRLIAKEFRKRYKEYVEKPGNGDFKRKGLAFSIGFSTSSEGINDFSGLMRKADEEMYIDKESKLGKLSPEQELGLLASKSELDSAEIRLRDAPKLWRQRGYI